MHLSPTSKLGYLSFNNTSNVQQTMIITDSDFEMDWSAFYQK